MGTGWSQDEEAAATAASGSQLQPAHQPIHDQGQVQRQYSSQKQSEEKQNGMVLKQREEKQSGKKSDTAGRVLAGASQLQPSHQPIIHGQQAQLQRQYSSQKQNEEKQSGMVQKQSGLKYDTAGRVSAGASQLQPSHQPIIHDQGQLQRQYSAQKLSEERQSSKKLQPSHQPIIHDQGQLQRQYSAQQQSEERQSSKQSEGRNRSFTVTQMKLPHNWEAILRDADTPTDKSSADKLYNQLSNGILLDKKRKKYWVDRNSNTSCFTLFARDLLITWADDPRYWYWPSVADTKDVTVEAAEVLAVCWLEVHGNFDTAKLSPGTLYEVVFVIMLKDKAVGWEVPVNFRLTLPNGVKQEHKENLKAKPRMQWVEIPVGEFRTSPDKNTGEMEISMYEYEGGTWKMGMIVKGVTIRAKHSTIQDTTM